MVLAVLCVLAAECLPPGSVPTRSVEVTDAPKVQRSVNAAVRYWHYRGAEPCVAPRVFLLDELTYTSPDGEVVHANGAARFGGCVIWLDRATRRFLSDREDCALIVHESGHTASLTFEPHWPDDPFHAAEGLMAPHGSVVPRVCRREFPKRKKRAANVIPHQ
jgi:hypothetical protein